MLLSAGKDRHGVWLRWLVVAAAFGLTVLLPLFSAGRDGSAFGLPLDIVLTTLLAPLALVLLSFWYAHRPDKAAGRGGEA